MEKADGTIDYMLIIEQVKEALEKDVEDLQDRMADLENSSDREDLGDLDELKDAISQL